MVVRTGRLDKWNKWNKWNKSNKSKKSKKSNKSNKSKNSNNGRDPLHEQVQEGPRGARDVVQRERRREVGLSARGGRDNPSGCEPSGAQSVTKRGGSGGAQ